MRRNSDFTSKRIDRLLAHPAVTTHYGDMVDVSSLHTLLVRIRPTEFLAAQSHVQVSLNVPDYSAEINALGSFRLLSLVSWTTVPILSSLDVGSLRGFCRHRAAKNEMTLFMPARHMPRPKRFAYWTVCNYREAWLASRGASVLVVSTPTLVSLCNRRKSTSTLIALWPWRSQ